MNPRRLTREVGRLLRLEREHARLTQQALADRVGTSQQRVSRFETGAYAPTATMIERLFDALGLQIRLEIEARDADVDGAIAAVGKIDDEYVEGLLSDLVFLLRGADGLRYLIDGELAAYLQGVPIQPTRFDLAVAEHDLPRLANWICLIPNCLRWNERWRDFSNYDIDPLHPGPLRWRTQSGELRVRLLPALPAPVVVRVADREFPVRPLIDVESDDPQIARRLRRLRAQSTEGSGGPSTSSASTMV
ncbi:MAG TPA: helix-turn-helix transcriptional regulator [Micromonosporaceae bacterium]|nr:helix-turn-helix transcriptional regulator [Micromonosporaceae bacterium]